MHSPTTVETVRHPGSGQLLDPRKTESGRITRLVLGQPLTGREAAEQAGVDEAVVLDVLDGGWERHDLVTLRGVADGLDRTFDPFKRWLNSVHEPLPDWFEADLSED
jgi:hypothetical protein